MTKIIGVSEARAIMPKPSTNGSRPRIDVARPMPRAVTSGTVTVEVVTPPESNAMPTIASGRDEGHQHDDDVAPDDQVLDRPPAQDAEDPEDDRRTDGQRHRQPQLHRVRRSGRRVRRRCSSPRRRRRPPSPAIAISAGSATVVEKPSRNPNTSSQARLPLRAKA